MSLLSLTCVKEASSGKRSTDAGSDGTGEFAARGVSVDGGGGGIALVV